ncbi:delta-aminolevulinic acid dehydratase-like [Ctenocephalides felis]|uniref:delta-aminolevulinic acid dehydratase-like n=1 Tax=Ctenocephalides felis TaxID=7515 RepID=UPI000E6E4F5A|nr:delta-aminolevulinic acid dehydratase-like [Ctenocephalides felis]
MALEQQTLVTLHSKIFHPVLRELQEDNVSINPRNFMYPIFLVEDDHAIQKISSMPGVCRFGIYELKKHLEPLVAKGLSSILLFGVPESASKDSKASAANNESNPVIRAIPLLKDWFPKLLIACDVCMCPYTDHGHCGIINEKLGGIDNDLSSARIAEIALSYAKAGAHIVAPSDMMDNRIHMIKKKLKENNLSGSVNILSYSAKFASSFYGPFRDAAQSKPAFGDRKCYQLPPGSRGLAVQAIQRDVNEGADMLMVKPGLPYLDVLRDVKNSFPNHMLFVYQVSGEYSMLLSSVNGDTSKLKPILMEVLISMRRAGADCIITYFTPLLLDWLLHKSKL